MAKITNEQKYKTAEERVKAFGEFCDNNECKEGCAALCNRDPDKIMSCDCMAYWLALEAEEKPDPCPFCGGDCRIETGFNYDNVVSCTKCDYTSGGTHKDTESNAIAAHNRVARAVRAARESEANNGK